MESLTATVNKAKADGSVARAVARICGCDLIVVDDIGMLPAGQEAAEAFYRVVDGAYERRSVAVTSNLHPSGFDSIMPKTLATATVDPLLHRAHLVATKGDSHRLAEALAGKGVTPPGVIRRHRRRWGCAVARAPPWRRWALVTPAQVRDRGLG